MKVEFTLTEREVKEAIKFYLRYEKKLVVSSVELHVEIRDAGPGIGGGEYPVFTHAIAEVKFD